MCVCLSHPSSTKDAFRLSRGAWDNDRVVITSSRKPTSNLRSSSCTESIKCFCQLQMHSNQHFNTYHFCEPKIKKTCGSLTRFGVYFPLWQSTCSTLTRASGPKILNMLTNHKKEMNDLLTYSGFIVQDTKKHHKVRLYPVKSATILPWSAFLLPGCNKSALRWRRWGLWLWWEYRSPLKHLREEYNQNKTGQTKINHKIYDFSY